MLTKLCSILIKPYLALCLGLFLGQTCFAASITRHDQTASGLQGWQIQGEHIQIQLNPLKPEQVRAFYLGRGFPKEVSEQIVNSCVYQVVIKNTSVADSDAIVSVNLEDWRVFDQQAQKALVPKEKWLEKWAELGASDAAIIAFKWATFPAQQVFEQTGDYGWGMILFGDQLEETFNVELQWRVNDEANHQKVEQLMCIKE